MTEFTGAPPPAAGVMPARRNPYLAALAVLALDRTAMVGGLIILAFVATALFAPWLAPYDPTEQSILDSLQPPSAAHWLGTDEYGRDLFSRALYGTRPALLVGVLSVLVSIGIGVPIGLVAGYRLGWLDRAVGWMMDIMLSFPSLLLALMIVTLLGSGMTNLIIAIGIAHVPIFVRLTRSSAMVVRNHDFVTASRSFGATDARILRRHMLPNVLGPIIVMSTLSIAGAIREEASLSFLGMGIQPPNASWGNLIRDGIGFILEAPWMAVTPGLALTLSVLAFNMIGDSLRDMLDPRDIAASTEKK